MPTVNTVIPVAELRPSQVRAFELIAATEARAALAAELGATAVRKLRFSGEIAAEGRTGWRLTGMLGATVVQACIVTLDPVTTRIDTPVTRLFLPENAVDQPEAGSEIEMPEDDSIEVLGPEIDLAAIMTEALALALPSYPRKADAELGEAVFAEDGTEPLTDETVKPFAGLAALRNKLADPDREA